MIDIDINSDKNFIYCSTSPNSVTRIGDVIILPKVVTEDDFISPKFPWSFLFKSREIKNSGGGNYDEIRVYTENYRIRDLIAIDGQKFSLAILQVGIQNSLAILTGCHIKDYNRDNKGLNISFLTNKCEMIYDR